jgi:hypothetical protein
MEHFEGIKNVNFKWGGFSERNTTMWSSVGAFEGHMGMQQKMSWKDLNNNWWGTYT